jgi:hypothetical protein
MVGQYRFFQCQSSLAIQNAYLIQVSEYLEQLLRCRSIQLSRASRVLARLSAHYNYIQVAKMIWQELDSSNSDV